MGERTDRYTTYFGEVAAPTEGLGGRSVDLICNKVAMARASMPHEQATCELEQFGRRGVARFSGFASVASD